MELTIFACQKLLNLSHFMWFSLILWKDSGLCGHNIESRNNDSEGPHLCVCVRVCWGCSGKPWWLGLTPLSILGNMSGFPIIPCLNNYF